MSFDDTLTLIQNTCQSGSRLGLDRMNELMFLLGNPEKQSRFIHVAGTNGKGSVCSMLSSVLSVAGYKVGLYTSPHLISYCERMKINGIDISEENFSLLAEKVISCAKRMHDTPTEYELLTAMAFLWFTRQKCDIVVLEVGLGGRLDATNVIPAPEVAVIMNIGLEHTEILGNTLAEIAEEKAGIIKDGCVVVTYPGTPEVEHTYAEICTQKYANLQKVRFEDLAIQTENIDGQCFRWKDLSNLNIRLLGKHQARNAAVALETLAILQKRGWNISEQAIRNGLSSAQWPARLEVLQREPLFLLDGAHNPQCAQALADSLRALLPNEKFIFIVGVLADKDYPSVLGKLMPLAQEFICLTPSSDRALSAKELAGYLIDRGASATYHNNIACGIQAALSLAKDSGSIVAFGSLYLAGDIRNNVLQS